MIPEPTKRYRTDKKYREAFKNWYWESLKKIEDELKKYIETPLRTRLVTPPKYVKTVPVPPIKGKITPISKVIYGKTLPISKKIKPKLPDLNTAFLRYRNDALEHHEKYMESVQRLNALLPDQYRIDLEKWFEDALFLIERQIGKYRSNYAESQNEG